MMNAGRPQDQAVAAAMRMARDNRKRRAEGGPAKPIAAKATMHHSGPIMSSVNGRTDHLPMNVPDGAYVLPADIVSGLGEGNTMAGSRSPRTCQAVRSDVLRQEEGRHWDANGCRLDAIRFAEGRAL